MSHALDSEIRAAIAGALSGETGVFFDADDVHLPSRVSAASVHIPGRLPARGFSAAIFPALFGAPLATACRMRGGWLLIDFSDSFYDALVARVHAVLPPASGIMETHAINRLSALARHGGSGCPRVPSFQRALLLSLSAQKSPGAYTRASRACEAMVRSIPPRERPALIGQSGALADAMARLLSAAR